MFVTGVFVNTLFVLLKLADEPANYVIMYYFCVAVSKDTHSGVVARTAVAREKAAAWAEAVKLSTCEGVEVNAFSLQVLILVMRLRMLSSYISQGLIGQIDGFIQDHCLHVSACCTCRALRVRRLL